MGPKFYRNIKISGEKNPLKLVKKKNDITWQNNCHKINCNIKICSPVFGFVKSTIDLVKSLNKLCFNFIWNGGPDRIKRKFIVKDISKGGLRMVKIEHFITSLNITWLRRQILQQNCTRNILSNIDLDDVYQRR